MSGLKQTPSQTVGPYFAYGLTSRQYGYQQTSIAEGVMADDQVEGQRIRIVGRVLDGEGQPVPDAMIEIWQADAQGRFAHSADPRGSNTVFKGFGRMGTGTDPEARFIFETIKPGAPSEVEAPHISVVVVMRGLLSHVYTRIYFPDEAERNAVDPVLQAVPTEHRDTLIAVSEPGGPIPANRFDIYMQGANETVFFDL